MAVAAAFWFQQKRINNLTVERDKYRSNTETLLQDVRTYQTKDSLNAAKVGNLELKLSEYKKYRADDAALIKSLQTKTGIYKGLRRRKWKRLTNCGRTSGIVLYICPATRLRPYYVVLILWNRGLSCTDARRPPGYLPGRT